MALVKCPECGKEISDKAPACPSCGCPAECFNTTSDEVTENNEIVNKEEKIKSKKKVNKKILISIIVVILLVCSIAGYFIYDAYKTNMKYTAATMLMTEHKYTDAILQYEELGEYKDSQQKIVECYYEYGKLLYGNKQYDEAIKNFEQVKDYSDSENLIKECKYEKAGILYEEKDYENAIAIYKEIIEFKDSQLLHDKCVFENSNNGQFIRSFRDALQVRWSHSSIEEYKDATELYNDRKPMLDNEYEIIKEFKNIELDDKQLNQYKNDYIEGLEEQMLALTYVMSNYLTYLDKWEQGYNQRAISIYEICNQYEVEFAEEYSDTYNEFMISGLQLKESAKIENALLEMFAFENFELTKQTSYAQYYSVIIENTTGVDFESLSFKMNVYDEEDVLIEQEYGNTVGNFKQGAKALFEFSTDSGFARIEPTVTFTIQ